MKRLFLLLLILSSMLIANEKIMIWTAQEAKDMGIKSGAEPFIEYYQAKDATCAPTVLVCPGGGYAGCSMDKEGREFAKWFNDLGINAVVLKYRLSTEGWSHPAPLQDATRAMRLTRLNAEKWGVDVDKIGVMGFSAGGHLASTIATHFDAGNSKALNPVEKMSSKPNLAILCYPVITMGPKTHAGSRNGLLGKNPTNELVDYLSNEKQVTPDTPPTYLVHAVDDRIVAVENSLMIFDALRANGVDVEMHILNAGGHGFGLGNGGPVWGWTISLDQWLARQGYVANLRK